MIVTESTPKYPVLPTKATDHFQAGPSQPYGGHENYQSTAFRQVSSTKRFLRAFSIALLICLLVGMLSGSLNRLTRWNRENRFGGNDDWPVPPGIHTHRCANFSDDATSNVYPYSSSASFSLPLSSNNLFLLARGQLINGDLQILQSRKAGNDVKVDVTVGYYKAEAIDRALVCAITRQSDENGVGMFTPVNLTDWSPKDKLNFHVTLTLPASSGSSALFIRKLATDLSNFSQQIDRLGDTVNFQTIFLKGSNGFINAKSLSAETADIRTSNGPIDGSFTASTSLSLVTSNGNVDVDVGLQNNNPDSSTQLTITNSNGWVRSAISLFSSKATDGKYDISTRTSNDYLDVTFPVSPVGSTLILDAQNANGAATVSLNSAYEGTFSLHTSGTPKLEVHKVVDPSGRGRPRVVESSKESRGYIEGKVHYNPSGKAAGEVNVKTSNGQVALKL